MDLGKVIVHYWRVEWLSEFYWKYTLMSIRRFKEMGKTKKPTRICSKICYWLTPILPKSLKYFKKRTSLSCFNSQNKIISTTLALSINSIILKKERIKLYHLSMWVLQQLNLTTSIPLLSTWDQNKKRSQKFQKFMNEWFSCFEYLNKMTCNIYILIKLTSWKVTMIISIFY